MNALRLDYETGLKHGAESERRQIVDYLYREAARVDSLPECCGLHRREHEERVYALRHDAGCIERGDHLE